MEKCSDSPTRRQHLRQNDCPPVGGANSNLKQALCKPQFTPREDESTDNIHSIFVDQWDWEKIIHKEDRNLDYLKETVRTVYKCLRKTEQYMAIQYDYIDLILPKEIFFITSQELEDLFPDNTPKEREYYITKAKGAVCIMQIGDTLDRKSTRLNSSHP